MIKKSSLLLILCFFHLAAAQIYLDVNAEIASRYAFRRFVPAGAVPVFALNASAYLTKYNISIAPWYVNSLGNFSAYRETGILLNYYHELRERMYLSGGISATFYPGRSDMPDATLALNLNFSDLKSRIPYFIESHFDPFIRSWYWKFSAAYTWDTFLPFQFMLGAGLDLFPHTCFGVSMPAGLSDISLQAGTYLALKNWYITPKMTYIIPWNVPAGPKMLLAAKVNIGYTF
ncbi:MAG: hypothetical protein PHX07_02345 [Candidatus Marinimicrobia bacterium]|jgi:hypothetical protein|nr:hypothetical protein [Candidatus Neomarinimicrobiota bacterium]MDD4961055.1 hypothetical protein [Candidatus Neomarinimicrobiota bacterium]MDD5709660.1 hypothetical protein [Candidatus Neomarinimicrobiota bacterium]MDX9777416.1 hypothetical protein [bacterium]